MTINVITGYINFPIKYKGEMIYEGNFRGEIGINVPQLLLILNTLKSESVEIFLREPNKSLYFREENSNKTIILLQPVKI